MADFENVAKQFTEFYYNQFDQDRKQLAPLYRDNSMLTFESSSIAGAAGISNVSGNDWLTRTFYFQVDDEQRPMNYSQTFQLLPDGAGSYFIFNDIFKLVFG
ncbi:nuclear transport factor 2 [Diplocarpon mali]|nr:nuclear transport factor 2 [Diplocarpon mali]